MMKLTSFRTYYSLLLILLLFGSLKAVTPTEDLDISFPDIEGWSKGKIVRFPSKDMGYGISYQSSEAGRITIYVYNAGLDKIEDGIESDTVRDELGEAEKGLYQFEEMGVYKNVKKIDSGSMTFDGKEDGVRTLRSVFNFSARGNPLISEIYLFGYRDHFIKLRATRPKPKEEKENAALTEFMNAMNKLFSGSDEDERDNQVG